MDLLKFPVSEESSSEGLWLSLDVGVVLGVVKVLYRVDEAEIRA